MTLGYSPPLILVEDIEKIQLYGISGDTVLLLLICNNNYSESKLEYTL